MRAAYKPRHCKRTTQYKTTYEQRAKAHAYRMANRERIVEQRRQKQAAAKKSGDPWIWVGEDPGKNYNVISSGDETRPVPEWKWIHEDPSQY